MKRRARAVAFGFAALACAGLAAAMAGGYRSDVRGELGPLRPVVVAAARIPAGHAIPEKAVPDLLETRRVPSRFAPAGALSVPEQAVGRAPAAAIPAGSYVLASQLRAPGGSKRRKAPARIAPGRTPVEITVSGAEALASGGHDPVGTRVDVVVTSESGGVGSRGHTYVAAKGVRLLALAEAADSSSDRYSASGGWTATLALTREQALRLIQAESFARGVTLIGH
jgi:Flp pilus assembly protein CpaB